MTSSKARTRGRCAADCGHPIRRYDRYVLVDDKKAHLWCETRALENAATADMVRQTGPNH